jgi:hypothetical protein
MVNADFSEHEKLLKSLTSFDSDDGSIANIEQYPISTKYSKPEA